MTVSSEVSSVSYNGNGSTQIFAVPYYFLADSHLRVILRAADGTETVQAITTNYTVSGAGNQAGGQVTMLVAPATGVTLVILRNVPATQETDYVANDPFPAESHERALDKLTMLLQQGVFEYGRALRVPDSDPEPQRLAPAAQRANLLLAFDALGQPITVAPVSGSASDLAANLANSVDPSKGAAMIGYKARTVAQRLGDLVSVKDFGAVGDGVANDTTAVQAAVNYLNGLGGGRLWFPRGTYACGKITVYSNIWLIGDGRDNSVIRLRNGSNTDLIYGDQSDSRWLTNSTTGVANLGLFDLTLDGNRANNTAGSCLANYGDDLYLQNLFITGAADYGIRSDFYDTTNSYGMEGHFINVKIDSCGKHGWLFDGPHDSVFFNVTVIDAGQSANNTYDGIQVGNRANGRFIGCHVWNRGSAFRHRYAVNLIPGGGGNEFTACHLEGAQSANVRIGCSNNMFDPSTRVYFPWGGINILINSTATLNTINCRISGPFAGRPDSYGIVLADIAGDTVSDNFIDCTSVENRLGAIWFNSSDGNNQIKVRGYAASGSAIAGTPDVNDRVDVIVRGASTPVVNNIQQAASVAMAASGTTTWTFPYPFAAAPKVTWSVRSPSGAMDGHLWISAIGSTSVTVFNNSTRTLTLDIIAERL